MSGIRFSNAPLGRRGAFLLASAALAMLIAGMSAAGILGAREGGGQDSGVVAARTPPANPAALTLREAWDATAEHIRGWGPTWKIAALASSDVYDRPDSTSGSDGRRVTWQAEVVDTPSGAVRWVRLTGGELVDAVAPGLTTLAGSAAGLERPAVDSPELLARALAARPSLGPGTDKAIGFHFSYGADPVAGRPAIAVLGATRGTPARVVLDPERGEVLRAEALQASGGPLLVSADRGRTWTAAGLEGLVRAVTADRAGGSEAPLYAAAWSGDALGLWRSADGGRSWARVAVLPASAGPAAHAAAAGVLDGQESVVVATNGGLWAYRVGSRRLEQIPAPGLVLDLAVDGDGRWHAAAMQPGDPASARAYTRDPDPGKGWVRAGDAPASALTSGPEVLPYDRATVRMAVASDGALVRTAAGGIEVSTTGGASWDGVAAGAFDLIVASPDGATLYAVRYPAVVMRSLDGGRSWEEVATVPGTRDAGLFAPTATVVLAARGGSFGWQPF
ncbi:hypothetical protein [Tepidiforma sp.]|uniref:hypothetical protein n=1 Tax=Tepidiforma sp. TaxID=2682230 RepID=UPI002582DDE8|nr:hypothetical protein [Tepidiforma sp.]